MGDKTDNERSSIKNARTYIGARDNTQNRRRDVYFESEVFARFLTGSLGGRKGSPSAHQKVPESLCGYQPNSKQQTLQIRTSR